MNIFFTSDFHFYHTNIIKYCNRPFSSVEEMNETLIENYNKVVKKSDTVYILGDFAFCSKPKYAEIIQRLNGRIHLIKGNHDRKMSHTFLESQFVWVKDYYELKHDGKKICLFHYPMSSWNKSHHGSFHAYGHVHNIQLMLGRAMDVGVDSCGYSPVHIDTFIDGANVLHEYWSQP